MSMFREPLEKSSVCVYGMCVCVCACVSTLPLFARHHNFMWKQSLLLLWPKHAELQLKIEDKTGDGIKQNFFGSPKTLSIAAELLYFFCQARSVDAGLPSFSPATMLSLGSSERWHPAKLCSRKPIFYDILVIQCARVCVRLRECWLARHEDFFLWFFPSFFRHCKDPLCDVAQNVKIITSFVNNFFLYSFIFCFVFCVCLCLHLFGLRSKI